MGNYLLTEIDEESKIATVTFNRPEKLNATLDEDLLEIRDTMYQLEEDENVKVIIFKGAGKHFGAGHDVSIIGKCYGFTDDPNFRPNQRVRLRFDRNYNWGRHGYQQAVLYCHKVTISMVHGYCFGTHFYIAMNSDLVIATPDATFTHPGWRYAGPMGTMPLYFLTMGVRKAKEIMLTGRAFTAPEALDCQLINYMVPNDELEAKTMELAQVIAAQPMDALVAGKSALEVGMDVMGMSAGLSASYITHTLSTNLKFEPGEYNLLKSRKTGGVRGAIAAREKHFSQAALRKDNGAKG